MPATEIRGHCSCGAIQFSVAKEPMWCSHCHCSDCRRYVASAVATFVGFEKEYFSLRTGEFGVYESSPGVKRFFCATCGTPMAYESEKLPGHIHVQLGALEKPEDYPAQHQVNCDQRLPWLNISIESPSN